MKAIKITDREYGLKRLTRKVQRLQSRIKALEEKNLSLDGADLCR